jgi:hypothetical protein
MAGAIGGIPEQIFALAVGAALLVPLSNLSIDWTKTQQEIAAAQQTLAVRKAATDYIKANWTTVYAWAASPQRITTSTLISAGYLPAGFSSTNSFGQTHNVVVRRSGTNLLEAVVVSTGGVAVASGRIAAAALRGGSDVGYVPYDNDPRPCSGCARGSGGSWEVSLSSYGSTGVSAQPGHFAGLLYFNGGDVLTDYLYRYPVPGLADANTMHADIDMGGNSIGNAKNITAIANIAAGGTVTGTSGVLPDLVVTAGSSCATPGLLGRETDGKLMMCENGLWTVASGSFGGLYQIFMPAACVSIENTDCYGMSSFVKCVNGNPNTGGCSCPSGTLPSLINNATDGLVVQCTSGSSRVTAIPAGAGTSGEGGGTGGGGGAGGDGGGGGGGT